jgi:hypothetical protein
MAPGHDPLAEALAAMPVSALDRTTALRALDRARGHLAPLSDSDRQPFLRRLPAHAVSAALLSADAVFAADACAKIARIFGG